ncbi:MAG: hypothetical protein HYZ57_01385 [Acidobacteria bacterium]|nr:hypothetical protein [Acidobacteriota bacterium]
MRKSPGVAGIISKRGHLQILAAGLGVLLCCCTSGERGGTERFRLASSGGGLGKPEKLCRLLASQGLTPRRWEDLGGESQCVTGIIAVGPPSAVGQLTTIRYAVYGPAPDIADQAEITGELNSELLRQEFVGRYLAVVKTWYEQMALPLEPGMLNAVRAGKSYHRKLSGRTERFQVNGPRWKLTIAAAYR